jgi:hypothetical protein
VKIVIYVVQLWVILKYRCFLIIKEGMITGIPFVRFLKIPEMEYDKI